MADSIPSTAKAIDRKARLSIPAQPVLTQDPSSASTSGTRSSWLIPSRPVIGITRTGNFIQEIP